jgi:ABC-type methionine transport system ATPase subunit
LRQATIKSLTAAAFTLKQVRQVREGNVVLDGVELEIMQGEITALVGASGAGKTSLLRLLNRLDDPTGGEIFMNRNLSIAMLCKSCAVASDSFFKRL